MSTSDQRLACARSRGGRGRLQRAVDSVQAEMAAAAEGWGLRWRDRRRLKVGRRVRQAVDFVQAEADGRPNACLWRV